MAEPYRYPASAVLEFLANLLELGIRGASILSEPAVVEVRRGSYLSREALSHFSLILRVEDPAAKEAVIRGFPGVREVGLDAWADYFDVEVLGLLALTQCINSRNGCREGNAVIEFADSGPCEEIAARSGELAPFLPKKYLAGNLEWPGSAPGHLVSCLGGGRERPLLWIGREGQLVRVLIDKYLLDGLGVHPYVLAALILNEERG